ncbi:hypothetical protein ACFOSC_08950 [Streptantibioticus rubrisoli]|uniref:Methyltransferase type 12 n=1 Tax=Streptantibioticus rubrisoli TaxID=1387313 RepID=A0ABT1P632_9ACTN|nr:hypothetical protein [Streptantibioticus rubrisoli]MCQ4040838.1 hypothetical protein [Streptantibioticus rubrisoli]
MTRRRNHTVPGKSCFDDIYDQPDPRAYFRRLAPLEYRIPQHAQPLFRRVHRARAAIPGHRGPVTVLDVCCSYGINAALLNHDLTLDELYEHYTGPQARDRTRDELIAWDKEFYASRRRPDPIRVLGLDAAANPVRYALDVGLLDDGFAEDLESAPPSKRLCRAMAGTGLITVTGGVGYISARTFRALLDCAQLPVWVVAFVLRTVSYAPVARALAEYGLATEQDTDHSYPQRLFTDPAEQRSAIEALTAAGGDPTGKEADGRYHTTLYLSRPGQRQPGLDALVAEAFAHLNGGPGHDGDG